MAGGGEHGVKPCGGFASRPGLKQWQLKVCSDEKVLFGDYQTFGRRIVVQGRGGFCNRNELCGHSGGPGLAGLVVLLLTDACLLCYDRFVSRENIFRKAV